MGVDAEILHLEFPVGCRLKISFPGRKEQLFVYHEIAEDVKVSKDVTISEDFVEVVVRDTSQNRSRTVYRRAWVPLEDETNTAALSRENLSDAMEAAMVVPQDPYLIPSKDLVEARKQEGVGEPLTQEGVGEPLTQEGVGEPLTQEALAKGLKTVQHQLRTAENSPSLQPVTGSMDKDLFDLRAWDTTKPLQPSPDSVAEQMALVRSWGTSDSLQPGDPVVIWGKSVQPCAAVLHTDLRWSVVFHVLDNEDLPLPVGIPVQYVHYYKGFPYINARFLEYRDEPEYPVSIVQDEFAGNVFALPKNVVTHRRMGEQP